MRKRVVSILTSVLFALGCLCGCVKATPNTVDIYMPDGAPALALAYAMSEDREEDGVNYHITQAESIAAYVSGTDEEKNADLCVLPVNLAAKLLGKGERYQMLGVVTHGNLFLLGEGEKITKDNAHLLQGKTVGVIQLANVPGLVTKAALVKLGLSYRQLLDGVAVSPDHVNLKGVQPLSDLKTLGVDYLVAASPIAERLAIPFVASLQELYGEGTGYPQAVLVAKKSLLEEKGEWLDGFLERVECGGEWLKTASLASVYHAYATHLVSGLAPAFTAETLSAQAVQNANAYFTYASGSKEEVKGFLETLKAVGAGDFALRDDFFYQGNF